MSVFLHNDRINCQKAFFIFYLQGAHFLFYKTSTEFHICFSFFPLTLVMPCSMAWVWLMGNQLQSSAELRSSCLAALTGAAGCCVSTQTLQNHFVEPQNGLHWNEPSSPPSFNPLPWAGCPPPAQAAHGPMHGLEHLQLSGQTVPGHHDPLRKIFLPNI